MSATLTPVPPAPPAPIAVPSDRVMVQLNAAVKALEEASDVPDVLDIRDWSQALKGYLSRRDEGLHATLRAIEVKLRAERRLGELLADMPKDRGGRPAANSSRNGSGLPPRLADLKITPAESHRWQRLASVPADVFEAHVSEALENGLELTTVGVLRLARPAREPDEPRFNREQETAALTRLLSSRRERWPERERAEFVEAVRAALTRLEGAE